MEISDNYIAQIRTLLSEDYAEKEIDEMLSAAEILEDGFCITVTYANGVVDTYMKEARIILIHVAT